MDALRAPGCASLADFAAPTKGCNHAETSTSSGCEGLLHPVVVDCGLGSCKMGVLPSIIACPWALSPAIHLRVAVRFLGQCV